MTKIKNRKTLFFILLVPALALGLAATVLLWRHAGGGGGGASPLDPERYKREWRSLQGNRYVFRGMVSRQLGNLMGTGRVLEVKNLDNAGVLPVFVPESLAQNFESGQRYKFFVFVQEDTLLVQKTEKF
jgi:hypothetical protein